ncbi:hypothetical protein PENSPDRAFT_669357 [Peniophora sp. CONT]|nr:hypothetical protein PENSPDRAFT_669357 [Peniophora sp. CONT]
MSSSRDPTSQSSDMDHVKTETTANDKDTSYLKQLQMATVLARRSQKHCADLQALLDQLNDQLPDDDSSSPRIDVPTQQAAEVLHAHDTEMEALRQELAASKQECKRLAGSLIEKERFLHHVAQERDSLSKLLKTRTDELEAAQAYLPAANSFTDTHILGLVHDLNYEILQASTSLADSFEKEVPRLPISEELSAILNPSVRRVGKPIAVLLSTSGDDSRLALHVGLQAFLARISKLEVNRWVFRARAPANVTLNSIMSAVRDDEPDHVAVRWSALTRKYARAAVDDGLDAREIATRLADQWADAVALAGLCSDMDPGEISALIMERAGTQILEVSRHILALNVALGWMVLNGWMSCLTARPGEEYDPAEMEMDYQQEDVGLSEEKFRVIGTTALGLQRIEGAEEVVLLKPRVALERTKKM